MVVAPKGEIGGWVGRGLICYFIFFCKHLNFVPDTGTTKTHHHHTGFSERKQKKE